jgi:nitrate/nitrite transport system substrate-binding protein
MLAGLGAMKRRRLSRRAFLKATAGTAGLVGALPAEWLLAPSVARAALKIEKEDLKLGFIKLTDMAPIAIAKELNFFEDEGLHVSTEPEADWKVLFDRVITGELDGAHMLSGQPLGATIGFGTKAQVITPFSMDLNGNGITVSNAVWDEMKKHIPKGADGKPIHPIKADALKKVVDRYKAEGKPFNMAMVFPLSTHNYELRYWLASGGIHPGFYSPTDISGQIMGDVLISVTPPPQLPATMEAGTILGYCVGEPPSGVSPKCAAGARSRRPSRTAGTPTSQSRSTAPIFTSRRRSSSSRKGRRRGKTSPGQATAIASRPTSSLMASPSMVAIPTRISKV